MTETSTRYSPEVCERAVRLVQDHLKEHPSEPAQPRQVDDLRYIDLESLSALRFCEGVEGNGKNDDDARHSENIPHMRQ